MERPLTHSSANFLLVKGDFAAPTSQRMLIELKEVHENLLWGLAVMDEVTDEPVADSYRHTSARLRLSQAGLKSSLLLGKILLHLSPRVSAGEAAELRSIKATHLQLLRTSTEHFGCWSADKIQADWTGYCAGYRTFRWNLQAGIATEKRALYPMLMSAH